MAFLECDIYIILMNLFLSLPESYLLVPRGLYEVQSLSWGIMGDRCVKNKPLYIINNAPYHIEATAVLKVQFTLFMPCAFLIACQ